MLKKNKIIYILFLAAVLIIPFSLAIAQAPIVPCGIGSDPKNACTLCHLIVGIHRLVTYGRNILITVAAVGIFISGVMYVVSSGNENAMTRAKGFLSASLVGFSVVLAAWFIVNVVMWVLSFNTDIIGKENWYTFTCSTQSFAPASSSSPTFTPPPTAPPASWYFETYNPDVTHGPYQTEGECKVEYANYAFSTNIVDPCYKK